MVSFAIDRGELENRPWSPGRRGGVRCGLKLSIFEDSFGTNGHRCGCRGAALVIFMKYNIYKTNRLHTPVENSPE
jgi:hypothetical protein